MEWLNREIDREAAQSAPFPSPKASRLAETFDPNRPVTASLLPDSTDVENASEEQVAAEVYDRLGPDTKSAAANARRGCLIIGILAFALLAGLTIYVTLWY